MVCEFCGGERCVPKEKNSVGVEIQEYSHETGWVSVPANEPFKTYCLADKVMRNMPAMPVGGARRTYSKLA